MKHLVGCNRSGQSWLEIQCVEDSVSLTDCGGARNKEGSRGPKSPNTDERNGAW